MKIYITSATDFEVLPLKEKIEKAGLENIYFHTSGVGILQSCFSIQKLIYEQSPDFLIQVGIAGTFDKYYIPGETVLIKEEFFGTCGVEENKEWKDVFDLNLAKENNHPFKNKSLENTWLNKYNPLLLKEVSSVTVDEISTDKNRITQLQQKYHPYTESMEGASLHYCALQHNIPFLQMRGLSNVVGDRNKQNWYIKDAVQNVCNTTFEQLNKLA